MKTTKPERDILVNMSEICEHLGMGEKQVRRMAGEDPTFPAKKYGRWVSSRRALDEWNFQRLTRRW